MQQARRFASLYMHALEQRPLLTKVTSSGSLMAVADVIRQKLEQQDGSSSVARPFAWDAARTGRLTSWAVVAHAPFVHWYHPVVERLFAPVAHRSGVTAAKVVFDQTLVAPPFLATFLSYMTLVEGRGLADARARCEQQLPPLLLSSWCVWGPAHCVTFNLPVAIRLLWQDCVRVYFGTIMSLRSNKQVEVQHGESEQR